MLKLPKLPIFAKISNITALNVCIKILEMSSFNQVAEIFFEAGPAANKAIKKGAKPINKANVTARTK